MPTNQGQSGNTAMSYKQQRNCLDPGHNMIESNKYVCCLMEHLCRWKWPICIFQWIKMNCDHWSTHRVKRILSLLQVRCSQSNTYFSTVLIVSVNITIRNNECMLITTWVSDIWMLFNNTHLNSHVNQFCHSSVNRSPADRHYQHKQDERETHT